MEKRPFASQIWFPLSVNQLAIVKVKTNKKTLSFSCMFIEKVVKPE